MAETTGRRSEVPCSNIRVPLARLETHAPRPDPPPPLVRPRHRRLPVRLRSHRCGDLLGPRAGRVAQPASQRGRQRRAGDPGAGAGGAGGGAGSAGTGELRAARGRARPCAVGVRRSHGAIPPPAGCSSSTTTRSSSTRSPGPSRAGATGVPPGRSPARPSSRSSTCCTTACTCRSSGASTTGACGCSAWWRSSGRSTASSGFYLTLPVARGADPSRPAAVTRQLARGWWARWAPAWRIKTDGQPLPDQLRHPPRLRPVDLGAAVHPGLHRLLAEPLPRGVLSGDVAGLGSDAHALRRARARGQARSRSIRSWAMPR